MLRAARIQHQDLDEVWSSPGGLLVFNIVNMNPHRLKVASPVERTRESNAVAIAKVCIHEVNVASKKLRVSLEAVDGSGVDKIYLMTAAALGVDNFSSLRCWNSRGVVYGFRGVQLDDSADIQKIFAGILDARAKAADNGFLVDPATDEGSTQTGILKGWLSRGLVEQRETDDGRAEWTLSPLGRLAFECSSELVDPELVFTSRAGVSYVDMTTFELMMTLASLEWRFAFDVELSIS
jgi:hypothetical protein